MMSIYYIGTALFVVGYAIRVWSIKTLGKDFSLTLLMPMRIVTSGPYRWVRHPSYSGTLLMLLGLSILSPILAINWLGFMFFLSRICKEEQLLRRHPDFKEFSKTRGIFLPKIRKGA